MFWFYFIQFLHSEELVFILSRWAVDAVLQDPKWPFRTGVFSPPAVDSISYLNLTGEFLSGHCPQPGGAALPQVVFPPPGAAHIQWPMCVSVHRSSLPTLTEDNFERLQSFLWDWLNPLLQPYHSSASPAQSHSPHSLPGDGLERIPVKSSSGKSPSQSPHLRQPTLREAVLSSSANGSQASGILHSSVTSTFMH